MYSLRPGAHSPGDRLGSLPRVLLAGGLAAASLAVSAFAPSLLAKGLIWGACAIQCQRLGWTAIEYSSWVAWVLAALIVALAGRWSHYEMEMARVLPARALKMGYSIGCASCIVLMAIAPSLLPEFFPGLVRQVSLRAAGVL